MKKWIQITSGRGPLECQLLVKPVYEDLCRMATLAGFRLQVIDEEHSELVLCSVVISMEGDQLDDWLKSWLGTIQWICKSPLRPFYKRKNWFIGCFELNGNTCMEFDERQVEFQTMRSSGAGGQHVNKVSSAVRAIYGPTGQAVQAMDTRSQWQNKQLAVERLRWLVYQANEAAKEKSKQEEWFNQLQIERGNPIRIYKGEKFKLVSCKDGVS